MKNRNEFVVERNEAGRGVVTSINVSKADLMIPRSFNSIVIHEISSNALNFQSYDSISFSGDSECEVLSFPETASANSLIIPKSLKRIDSFLYNVEESINVVEGNKHFVKDDNSFVYQVSPFVIIFVPHSARRVFIRKSVFTTTDSIFKNCWALKSVYLPYSFREISNNMFSKVTTLDKIEIGRPNMISKIGESAFLCAQINSFSLPSSVEVISSNCFSGCPNLKFFHFPKNSRLKRIEKMSFSLCFSLRVISFPQSLEKIGFGSFRNCRRLQNIVFHNDSRLISIKSNTFRGCINLRSINFPKSLKKIGVQAFCECSNLVSFSFPVDSMLETVKSNAFEFCSSLETSEFPPAVKITLYDVFKGCPNIDT